MGTVRNLGLLRRSAIVSLIVGGALVVGAPAWAVINATSGVNGGVVGALNEESAAPIASSAPTALTAPYASTAPEARLAPVIPSPSTAPDAGLALIAPSASSTPDAGLVSVTPYVFSAPDARVASVAPTASAADLALVAPTAPTAATAATADVAPTADPYYTRGARNDGYDPSPTETSLPVTPAGDAMPYFSLGVLLLLAGAVVILWLRRVRRAHDN